MRAFRIISIITALLVFLPISAKADGVPSDLTQLFEQGKLDEAIKKATEQMEKRKRDADLPYFIGTCYEKMLKNAKAEEFYQKALKIKDKHLPSLYNLGMLVVKDSTRLEEAKGYFERGLSKAKGDKEKAMFEDGLGFYYLYLKDYSQADKKFRTAQFLDPGNCEYSMHLGDANYEKGAFALAITSYTKVLTECDSLNEKLYFRLGKSYVAQREYTKALGDLSNAIRLDSGYVEAYNLAGKIYILAAMSSKDQQAAVQKYTSSIWMFRKFIGLTDEAGEAEYYIAKAFQALGYADSAVQHFEAAMTAGYVRGDLALDVGKMYAKAGQFDKAVERLIEYEENLLAEDPDYEWTEDDAAMFYERAKAYAGMADSLSRTKAGTDFERAWSLDSSEVSWMNDIGFNYYYLGKYDSSAYTPALATFENKIALDTTNARSWLNAAYCYMRMKDWGQTADYLKRVTMLDSANCDVNKLIASSLSQQKKYTESREYYEKWGACDSTTYEAEKWIGFTYLVSKPPEGNNAVTHLMKSYNQMMALEMADCDDKDVVTWIAQGYALAKQYEKSMKWINKGLRCDPNSKTLIELKKSVQEALDAY